MKHGIIKVQAYSTMACIYPNNKYVTFNKARHSGGYGWSFLIILNHRLKSHIHVYLILYLLLCTNQSYDQSFLKLELIHNIMILV